MRGLLVRIGADKSEIGGGFNGPVNSRTGEFTYVPIPEKEPIKPRMEKLYAKDMLVSDAMSELDVSIPLPYMHLDPDFKHLTYGDERGKGRRIHKMWKDDGLDFLVFYAGLRDVNPDEKRLVYAIVGFYMIDEIVPATKVHPNHHDENAHTRRVHIREDEIVVRAKRGQSGRLKRCVPIGCYRPRCDRPHGHASYRVIPDLLSRWGGLSVSDGYVQRNGYIPEFKNAKLFLKWFGQCSPDLILQNNLSTHCCCSV